MNRYRYIALLALSLLMLVTHPAAGDELPDDEIVTYSDGETIYKFIQVVRYVLDTTRLPGAKHFSSILGGTVPFGDQYYHPRDPTGPVPVDCNNTKILGVAFWVNRPEEAQYRRKQLVIRFVWTHSAVVTESEKLDHSPYFDFRRGQSRMFATEYIELLDEIKFDGVISVEGSIGSDVVLRNSFELSGCPDQTLQRYTISQSAPAQTWRR